MDDEGPNWKLEDDYQSVTLTLPEQSEGTWNFKTAHIDELLKFLGAFRTAMKPEHSYDDPRRQVREAVINPRWATETDLMHGQVLLHLRHPGFGTLTFLLPKQDAHNLGQSLIDLAATQPLGPPSGRAS